MLGSQRGKQHHRETENDSGQVLIDQVIRNGRLVFGIDLAEQYHTRAGSTRQHTVHRHKLLLAVAREKLSGNEVVIPISREQTDHAQDEQDVPILLDVVQTDRGDTRDDHQIEEEAAHTVHQERVDVLLFDDARAAQHIQCPLEHGCHQHAEQEVEAEEHRAEAGDKLTKHEHQTVRDHIDTQDDGDLHRHLVDAAVHRNLIGALDLLGGKRRRALLLGNGDLALFLEDVQMDDTADRRAQKAQCRDGQTEAASANKAVFCLVDITVVECLTRSLTEAEGEQNAGGLEEILDDKRRDHRDAHTENGLQKIGRDRRHARIEHLDRTAHTLAAATRAKGGSNESEGEAMVGDDLHRAHTVATEKGGVKQKLVRDQLINDRAKEQQNATQHRGRNKRNTQKSNRFFEQIGNQKAEQQHGDQADKAPDLRVPKIEVLHT